MTNRTASPIERLRQHYPLLLISALYSFAALDRGILSLVVDQVKLDLSLSDTAFATIAGLGFSVPQFLLALPVARWVDAGNRKKVVIASVLTWSGATVLGGAAANSTQLLASRIAVGAGESSNSVYHSMISDLYRREKRSKAIGVYYAFSALVSLIWFGIGGTVAEQFGWRWTMVFAGLPGLILVLLVWLTFSDPERGKADGLMDGIAPPFTVAIRFVLSQRTYVYTLLAHIVMGLGYGVLLFWYPAFLMRVHGLSPAMVGILTGLGIGLASMAGYLLGGPITERLCRDDESWRARYPAIAILIFAVCLCAASWIDNLALSVTLFSLGFFFQASMLSGIIALTQSVLPPRMRGTGAATFNVCAGLAALGLAPMWSGMLNDFFVTEHGEDSIRYSFLAAGVVCVLAAVLYNAASSRVRGDLERATSGQY